MRRRRDQHVTGQTRRRALSRRTFLGGAAATLALPFLEAMRPTLVRAAGVDGVAEEAPRRLLFYYVPNGIHMPAWTPVAEGAGYDLPPILASLAPVHDQVSVLTGLGNKPAIDLVAGDHARGTGAFLTCVLPRKSEGENIVNGKSVDQFAAEAIGSATLFPSLQLGTVNSVAIGTCDSGYSCTYSRNISWAGPSQPLPKISNPRVLFDRLFAGMDPTLTTAELGRRRRLRTSVLDYAAEDAKRLQALVGASDRAKLEEYLTSVREVETLIEASSVVPKCEVPGQPGEDLPFPALVEAMHELMVLAFQCDLTRVASFMFGDAGSNRGFEHLGISGAHHQISHHQGDPENLAKLQAIDTWEVEQLSNLLQRMQGVTEGEASLLDNSLVYWSSEIEDGDAHRHTNLPILLAGRAGGLVDAGRHIVYGAEEPVADLYITLLSTVGVGVDSFGDDGTGPLAGVLV